MLPDVHACVTLWSGFGASGCRRRQVSDDVVGGGGGQDQGRTRHVLEITHAATQDGLADQALLAGDISFFVGNGLYL